MLLSASSAPEPADIAAPISDEELLARLADGHEEALLALFQRYNRLVFSIGCRILKDEGEAEDLVQEVFMRLRTEQASFNPAKGSARTWMVQVFYRRAFDRRAYLARRHFYNGTELVEETKALVGARNLEADVIDRLTTLELRSAFDQLTERQKVTLELCFFEGMKLGEIAERTGEDLSNVRHHYYRGLERLRQVVREMARNEKRARS
jgi:RNA polymerase sigma-70 factor (ECF subfamily)